MSHLLELTGENALPALVRARQPLAPRDVPGKRQTDPWNHVALDMVQDSVLFFSSPRSCFVSVNRAACEHLGYSRHELQESSLADIAPHAVHGALAGHIAQAMRGTRPETWVQTVLRRQDGTLMPVRCSIASLQTRPKPLLLLIAKAIGESSSSLPPSTDDAVRDSLTGLPNREWLWHRLEQEAEHARRRDYRYAVLFVDVDRFKTVNDTHGHVAGDHVLRAVADRLTSSVRPGDTVSRYGGDEFVVLMRDVRHPSSIRQIARRIGQPVTATGTCLQGKPWRAQVTVSVGAAVCGAECAEAWAAIECADRAMYRAKALGRNGHFVIDAVSDLRMGGSEPAQTIETGRFFGEGT